VGRKLLFIRNPPITHSLFWTGNHQAQLAHVLAEAKDPRALVTHANRQGYTPLHLAVSYGAAESLEMLLAAGADKDARTLQGETPLHRAVRFANLSSVQVLLDAGADVNAQDNTGKTPIDLVAHSQREGKAKLLQLLRETAPSQGQ
jgi:ankyrin repeat protein